MRVKVLVEGGAISKDFADRGDGSSCGSNNGVNQLVVWYREGPSLVDRKIIFVVHILGNLVSVKGAATGLQREPK